MRYLCDTRPNIDESIYPKPSIDPKKRARIDEYLDWHHVGLRKGSNSFVFLKLFVTLRKLPQPNQSEIEEAERRLNHGL